MRVSQRPPPWEDAVPDPSPVDPDWFVVVQGKQIGPLDPRALVERVRSGEVHGRTFVWRDGFDGWRRALEVPELVPVLEDAGVPTTPPRGPITPADSLAPTGSGRTPRSSTPREGRRPGTTPPLGGGPGAATEELELARAPRRIRRPPPPSDLLLSGLHRRSPWKTTIALALALALPVGGLALFASLRKPALEVRPEGVPEAAGSPPTPVSAPVRRVQELRDLLLGKRAPSPPPAAPTAKRPAVEAKAAPAPARPAPDGPKTAELRALYGDPRKPDVGPRVRRSESAAAGQGKAGTGPSNDEVARVVGQTQSAFQSCIEQQLRKTPGFRGGKVNLVATVGSSGTVKQAQLDRRDLDGTSVGECLKARARRMVFAAFTGDDVDVEIPLVLTTSL